MIPESMTTNSQLQMLILLPLATTLTTKLVDILVKLLTIIFNFCSNTFVTLHTWYTKKFHKEYMIEVDIMTTQCLEYLCLTNFGFAFTWYADKHNLTITSKLLLGGFGKIENFRANCISYVPAPTSYALSETEHVHIKNTSREHLENNIYIIISHKLKKAIPANNGMAPRDENTSSIQLSSELGFTHIKSYINKINSDYLQYLSDKSKNSLGKLFMFSKVKDELPVYAEYKYDITQTFDNLFFPEKDDLLKKLELLKDHEYHNKRGLKRKITILLYGEPGTGKTSCVNAIANYTGRAIISTPISRVTENNTLEKSCIVINIIMSF